LLGAADVRLALVPNRPANGEWNQPDAVVDSVADVPALLREGA
jgi:hypothetical protein